MAGPTSGIHVTAAVAQIKLVDHREVMQTLCDAPPTAWGPPVDGRISEIGDERLGVALALIDLVEQTLQLLGQNAC